MSLSLDAIVAIQNAGLPVRVDWVRATVRPPPLPTWSSGVAVILSGVRPLRHSRLL